MNIKELCREYNIRHYVAIQFVRSKDLVMCNPGEVTDKSVARWERKFAVDKGDPFLLRSDLGVICEISSSRVKSFEDKGLFQPDFVLASGTALYRESKIKGYSDRLNLSEKRYGR